MFGHDMSWASFNVLEVMASPKYHQKRVGYLGAIQSFRPDTEVLMLATNLLKKVGSRPLPPSICYISVIRITDHTYASGFDGSIDNHHRPSYRNAPSRHHPVSRALSSLGHTTSSEPYQPCHQEENNRYPLQARLSISRDAPGCVAKDQGEVNG